ncbi:MAG: AgmX/PglI C-terminal domain-containing protein [Deltaproteobacteria bacterium]|nr:AgmX/PglI C-terminal domain-containing protein [Deltaproteobacteria bacterium]
MKALLAVAVLLLSACGTGSQFKWEESGASKAIRRPIEENLGLFKLCLEDERKRNPDFEGDLTMDWQIDDQGIASKAMRRLGSIRDGDFVRCVGEKIEAIKFSPAEPGKTLSVTYPFQFQRKSN